MAKVTSKLQLTLPKALARQFNVQPGDDVEWVAAGDTIRLVLAQRSAAAPGLEERLRLFDDATRRQQERQDTGNVSAEAPAARDWTREELYDRGNAD